MRLAVVLLCLGACEEVADVVPAVPSVVAPDPATGEPADPSVIPPGEGWLRGGADIECYRGCTGLPGPPLADGTSPPVSCEAFELAHCVSFENAGRLEAWCYCSASDCTHRRASLVAGEFGERSKISNCTPTR
jgi:hypothetical protein